MRWPAWTRVIPTILWMALIFLLSSERRFPQPSARWDDALAVAAHLFLFGTLALLMILVAPQPSRLAPRHALAVVFVTIAYGISDEIHQSFVPGRDASVFDVVVDGVGAVVVTALWRAISRIRRS